MKSNNSLTNGGKLLPNYYGAYTKYLLDFANYMSGKGAPLYAISLQNEPDWHPNYESAGWNGSDFVNYLVSEGSKFGGLKVIVGESVGFNFSITDRSSATPLPIRPPPSWPAICMARCRATMPWRAARASRCG